MTQTQAQFLVKVTEDCGNQEIDLRDSYSGRGMYDRTTHGVVVNSVNVLLADCINYLRQASDEVLEEVPNFQKFSQDNMGMNTILY